jgi:hypothetical protein
MPNTWTVNVYDFVSFTDSLVFKPAYVTTSDSLSFSESLTVPIFQASWIDGISFNDEPVTNVGIHHLEFTDTITFVDDAMQGGPQTIADYMVMVDEFDVAANLLLDKFVFTDMIT